MRQASEHLKRRSSRLENNRNPLLQAEGSNAQLLRYGYSGKQIIGTDRLPVPPEAINLLAQLSGNISLHSFEYASKRAIISHD